MVQSSVGKMGGSLRGRLSSRAPAADNTVRALSIKYISGRDLLMCCHQDKHKLTKTQGHFWRGVDIPTLIGMPTFRTYSVVCFSYTSPKLNDSFC